MKKLITTIITIAIMLMVPQEGMCLRPMSSRLKRGRIEIKTPIKSEFWYYTRDEKDRLLKEPSGFPGQWEVVIDSSVSLGNAEAAAVQRMVKSFAVSAVKANREDCLKAKFTVVEKLADVPGDVLAVGEGFWICKSRTFGFEIVVDKSFLYYGITKQRELFARVLKDSRLKPASLDYAKQVTEGKSKKKFKIMIFDDVMLLTSANNKSISSSSIAIAGFLKKQGVDVEIDAETSLHNKDSLRALQQKLSDVDMVCLSVFDKTVPGVCQFTSLLRKAKPELVIAVGGPAVTVSPEHVAAVLPDANIFYRGDIEAGFGSALQAVLSGWSESPLTVQNMLVNSKGIMLRVNKTYYFSNLHEINRITEEQFNKRRIDFSFIRPGNLGLFMFMSSIGCIYDCAFCSKVGGKVIASMHPEQVIEILKAYQQRLEFLEEEGADIPDSAWVIKLCDDNFFHDKERALRILQLFRSENLRLKISSVQASLNAFLNETGVDKDFIRELAKFSDIFSGAKVNLLIGTDGLINTEIRRLGKPGYTELIIEQVIAELDKNKITNEHYLILTNPWSRVKDLLRTMLRLHYLERRYNNTIIHKLGLPPACNVGVLPSQCTRVTNTLIREGRENLLEYIDTGIGGFNEYRPYAVASYIMNPFIPSRIQKVLMAHSFMAKKFSLYTNFGQLNDLFVVLAAINFELATIERAEQWQAYNDLLDDDIMSDFSVFFNDLAENLSEAAYFYGATKKSIEELHLVCQMFLLQLQTLQKRFNRMRNGDGSQGDRQAGRSEHRKPPVLPNFTVSGRGFLALIDSAA